jgi:ribosome biogenesis protein YTM1
MDTMMADGGVPTSRQGQVQVHFITNSPDIELPEEKRQLLVPTSKQNSHPEIMRTGLTD